MTYKPAPFDTHEVRLPEALAPLMEKLARNIHENWSQERLRQGWTWGPVRDDNLKTHPGLIPYEELTEDEKAYDRITSSETLKTILLLGFRIEKTTNNEDTSA